MHWQGRAWPFHYLPRLLGDNGCIPETGRYNAVLLIRSGQGTTAIHVDEMVGNQEVVVKNIGPQLARVPGISGATVLGTGEIVLIINPVQLAQRPGIMRYDPAENERITAELRHAAAASARKLVMVVDDSLTVRKFTTRLLTREGYEVVTARDGIDALKLLTEHAPDAILLDIEMPRMDGFEFAKTIKGDPKTSGIPIIMIYVPHGGQASEPGGRAWRRAFPRQAVPGGRVAAEPPHRDVERAGAGQRHRRVDDAALTLRRRSTLDGRERSAQELASRPYASDGGSRHRLPFDALVFRDHLRTDQQHSAAISSDSSTTIAVVSEP